MTILSRTLYLGTFWVTHCTRDHFESHIQFEIWSGRFRSICCDFYTVSSWILRVLDWIYFKLVFSKNTFWKENECTTFANFKMVYLDLSHCISVSQCAWKFRILRETNFRESTSFKSAVFWHFSGCEFCLEGFQSSKSAKTMKNQNSEPLNVLKWHILTP